MTWLRVPLSPEAARALGAADPSAYARVLSITLTGVAAQGFAGAVAALVVPRLRVVHGLLAGSVAGVILIGAAVLHLKGGSVPRASNWPGS